MSFTKRNSNLPLKITNLFLKKFNQFHYPKVHFWSFWFQVTLYLISSGKNTSTWYDQIRKILSSKKICTVICKFWNNLNCAKEFCCSIFLFLIQKIQVILFYFWKMYGPMIKLKKIVKCFFSFVYNKYSSESWFIWISFILYVFLRSFCYMVICSLMQDVMSSHPWGKIMQFSIHWH